MRLPLVELTRFRSRRAIVLMLLAAALLTAVLAGTTIYETRAVTAEDRAAAQAMADREAERPWIQRELRRCENNPQRFMGRGATPEQCAQMIMPQADWFLHRPKLSLAEERGDSGMAVLFLVSAVMIIVGTTFAGADWASGSMSNQLLFEPRRVKVWLAKAVAVFLGAAVASAVIVSAFWLTLYLTAESRGLSTGATVQEDIRWMVARGVLLAGLGALGGYALTMLLRHTVGSLALMFGYAVGGEALIASVPIEGIGRWSLANNVFAWIRDGHEYYDFSICGPRGNCGREVLMTLSEGAAYLGALLAMVVVLSVVLFRRRDIP